MALGFTVPTTTVNNIFSVTLTSDEALTGVEFGDFVLRREDAVFTELDSNNATLTQVEGTHNWRIDFTLTGTFDHDFLVRLRPRRLQENGVNVPSSVLNSPTFHVDTNYTPPPPVVVPPPPIVTMPPVIAAIAQPLNILVDTPYRLRVRITGNPSGVTVEGDLESFDYDWDADAEILDIIGTPDQRLSNKVWIIKAVDRGDAANIVESRPVYNVVTLAPILETLPMIHLYKGIVVNIDIFIQNVPSSIIAKGLLIGMKARKDLYGAKISGNIREDANFTVSRGDIRITAPYDGGTAPMRSYPYTIEAGTPPTIGAIQATPKGDFAEITFDDLSHALGYEWTLEKGDADQVEWNFFNDSRNVINPSKIEVTPGNLSVTLKFPNISGATLYEYQLESETASTDWISFTGTLADNMITTIIPNLKVGEQILRLRVAGPWIGVPVEIKVYGGRLVYALHEDSSGSDDHALYIFHTGVASGAVANRIKRILIPDDINNPADLAIDFKNNHFYVLDRSNDVHVFSLTTDNDVEATRIRQFTPPSTTPSPYGLGFHNDVLYASNYENYAETFLANTANGQTATRINRYDFTSASSNERIKNLDVTDDLVFIIGNFVNSSTGYIWAYSRTPINYSSVSFALNRRISVTVSNNSVVGFSVIGNNAFVGKGNNVHILNTTKNHDDDEHVIHQFMAPAGCDKIVGLVVGK